MTLGLVFPEPLQALPAWFTGEPDVYLVGGAVRDLLMGRPIHDLDFTVAGNPGALARRIADHLKGDFYMLDEARHTSRVILTLPHGERFYLDFAEIRGESLEQDLLSRDFSANAIALPAATLDRLIDPANGVVDIQHKRLRVCSSRSFLDDPCRILRAVRQSISLNFRIQSETYHLLKSAVALLPQVSPERQRDEIMRILEGNRVRTAIEILDHCGALASIFPELAALKGVQQSLPHVQDAWAHTLETLAHLEALWSVLVGDYAQEAANLTLGTAVLFLGRFRQKFADHFSTHLNSLRSLRGLLFYAALYHDIAKPETRSTAPDGRTHFYHHEEQGADVILSRSRMLCLSTQEAERAAVVVRHHLRPHLLTAAHQAVSNRSIYRFFKDTGEAGIDVCLLALADFWAVYSTTLSQDLWLEQLTTCRSLIEAYWQETERIISPPRLLNGHELMQALNIEAGPLVGQILAEIREAQAAGEITSKDQAIRFAHSRKPSSRS